MNNNQMNTSQIEVQSLSQEISEKAVVIARLQGNLYKLAAENQKLKKQVKDSKKTKDKGSK